MANPFRFLNPLHVLRLERDLVAMAKQREGDKRGIKSLVDSIGRQAMPGSEAGLRSRVVAQDGRIHALEIAAGLALIELRRGRASQAESVLSAILDSVPADQREAS